MIGFNYLLHISQGMQRQLTIRSLSSNLKAFKYVNSHLVSFNLILQSSKHGQLDMKIHRMTYTGALLHAL